MTIYTRSDSQVCVSHSLTKSYIVSEPNEIKKKISLLFVSRLIRVLFILGFRLSSSPSHTSPQPRVLPCCGVSRLHHRPDHLPIGFFLNYGLHPVRRLLPLLSCCVYGTDTTTVSSLVLPASDLTAATVSHPAPIPRTATTTLLDLPSPPYTTHPFPYFSWARLFLRTSLTVAHLLLLSCATASAYCIQSLSGPVLVSAHGSPYGWLRWSPSLAAVNLDGQCDDLCHHNSCLSWAMYMLPLLGVSWFSWPC